MLLRTLVGVCLVASASAYAPSAFVARRANACSASMSCAAVAPAPSPLEAGAASLAGALAGLLGDLAERVGEFELPNVLMAIPGRKGPSNKARAGVSGFRARKLTKTGQKVLRNRRAKGRKYLIPSPGRNAIHGL